MSFDPIFHPRIIKNVQIEGEPCVIPSTSPLSPEAEEAEQQLLASKTLEKSRQESELLLQQARDEAGRILQQARQDAAQILHEAEVKLKQLETQAYEQGMTRGENEGLAQLKQASDQFDLLLSEAQKERGRMLEEVESEAVRMILDIVRKILKIEPIINEQVVIRVTRAALQRLQQEVSVHVYIHPADLDLLHFNLSHLASSTLDIVLEPDEKIAPGGCLVKSRTGTIDATLDSQFETVASSFLAVAEG